jgi:hypothetical protein
MTLSTKQSNASAAWTIHDQEEHTSANHMSPINCRLVVSVLWRRSDPALELADACFLATCENFVRWLSLDNFRNWLIRSA